MMSSQSSRMTSSMGVANTRTLPLRLGDTSSVGEGPDSNMDVVMNDRSEATVMESVR